MTLYRSPFADSTIPRRSITDHVFAGLAGRAHLPALTCGLTGEVVTGGDLIDRVRRLAGGLVAHGMGQGHVIALMAPNMPAFAVVFHATALAGGTLTTVNPTYTAAELRHQLTDSGAGVLITVAAFLATARDAVAGTAVREIFLLDADPGGAEGARPLAALTGDPLARQVAVDLDHDAVVLPYSSGTTGLPKGVVLTHRNLVANVVQMAEVRQVTSGEVTLAFLPFFHIYGMQVLMNLYLAAGSHVVTLPRFDFETVLRLIARHRPSQLYVAPPVVLALAKHPLVETFDLSSLRSIMSGAAPLGADLAAACAARIGCDVEQGYGMTEMSPVSHATPLGRDRAGSAGLLLPNTECRIVDPESGQDCAPGTDGELIVRGPQVMRGYLNNPAATARTLDTEGWLHTGDLGHVDADGYLFVVDRVKELIKVKGFQVAPAELEALIVTHPGIADAAVIGRPDDEAGEVPVAFVTRRAGSDVTAADVQAHLAGKVASYKQLRAVTFIDVIPKSASGKILRRVLRAQA